MTDKLKKILVSLEGLSHEELIKAIEGTLFLIIQDDEVKEKKIEEVKQIAEATKKMQGEKGEKGDMGERGEIGPQGLPGEKGEPGIQGERGIQGISGLQGERGKDGLDGQNGKDGKQGSPDTPEQVRDKLEELTGEDRLDKSAIKGLAEEIERLEKIKNTRVVSVGGLRQSLFFEIPSGAVNGVNTVFEFSTIPNPNLLFFVVNGQLLRGSGIDYTLSKRTITTTTAPPTNSIIQSFFSKF